MKKLYETQAYLSEWDTVITACIRMEEKIFVVLEETIFFPNEGGQYADTGYLEYDGRRIRVLNGQLLQDTVYTQVEQELGVGTKVHCVLDWDKRFMRMQQHTGEHILTGVIHNRYGFDNVGFHLSDEDYVTMDLNGTLCMEQVSKMETIANAVIYRNLAVTDWYPTKEELPGIVYRSKIEITGQVRLISIGDVDICACCAPHVARTGEVGIIKVVAVQNYKGGTRISMLAGQRALEYCQKQQQILTELAGWYSTQPKQLPALIRSQKEELEKLHRKLSQMAQRALLDEIENLPQGVHQCLFVDEEITAFALKNGFNAMAKKFSGYVGIFIGNDTTGYHYYAGSAVLDSQVLAQKMKEELNAKGGGSKEMIQGRTQETQQSILAFFQALQ